MGKTKVRAARPWSRRNGPLNGNGGTDTSDEAWDYVVIGSGMGGMAAAAMLTRIGARVLVLEQHLQPGGFTHTFARKGWTWDVGVHAVGEVTLDCRPGQILNALAEGRIEWCSLGAVYDEFHFPGGFSLSFPDSLEGLRARIVDAFPDGGGAFDGWMARVDELAGLMDAYYVTRTMPRSLTPPGDPAKAERARQLATQTTTDVLRELTDDPRLRAVLSAQWGYFGSPPERSSFAIQAMIAKHFARGAWYPVGGAATLSAGLLQTVANGGGWTRVGADVDEILIEDGKACGVRLTTGEELRARGVISGAGTQTTLANLLPAEHREQPWARRILGLPATGAHVGLYLGFEGDIVAAGASAANQWIYETWDPNDGTWQITPDGTSLPRSPCLYCSFPSLKDPDHDPGPRVMHTGEVVTFVPREHFVPWVGTRWRKRGPAYEQFKARLQEALLEQFFDHRPDLRPLLRFAELSTPLSTDHFCRSVGGAIYGIEPTPERFATGELRAKTPVPGLYFAGVDVTSVGVMGAMMGGVLAASAAEPLGAMRFMRTV